MNMHRNKQQATGRRTVPAMKRHPLSAVIIGTLALFAAGTGLAQETETAAPTAEQSEAVTLDEVIVTANKRSENIRKVASAITVIGGDQLENTHATQLSDYADYIPGFQVTSNGSPGKTQVSMRGIAPLSSGSTVGTYIDETPVGSSGIYQAATILALDLLPYDIDRVEVLRGPQGTLYGAGSMGGLLKYVTREPDLQETEFRVGGGISNVEGGDGIGHNVRFGANLPMIENRLGMRLSYARNDLPGYIDNSVDGREDINNATQTSARAAVLWRGDSMDAQFTVLRQTIESDNNATMALDPVTGEPLTGDLENQVFVDSPFTKQINYYAATFDWDLGWADFTSATGYSDTTTANSTDSTIAYGEVANLLLGLPEPGSSYFLNELALTKFTWEFRLTSKAGGTFEWMLGGFYSNEDGDNSQLVTLNQLDGSPLPPPYDSIAGTLAYLELPTSFEEIAVFANGTWAFTDRFKIGAGVRYSENRQDFSQNVTEGILLPIQNSPNSSKEDVFTWSLTPQFQFNDDMLLYGKVATGYQPGGPNVLLPGIPPQVDSSMLTSYEIGLKSQFADGRLILDLAAFRIDWEDIQVITSFAGNNGLVNGGEATSQGLELATQFRATENLTLGFNGAYTDADVAEDFPTVYIPSGPYIVELNTGLGGDKLPYVPELQWSATWTTPSWSATGKATSVAVSDGWTTAWRARPSARW
ncbi:TonB-dependent receptor domain-containing protein [Arenimonas daejeonensis]|uniref:TonB-dependent receptor domain-containing protein n=1 Tax=Arenimonas daejeonensis TaxID=370777 RepID=UPI0011BE1CE3|nr:TonB-dependent receptor [Arenimonas daejeonensis]